MTSTFTLVPEGRYALVRSQEFLRGFTPAQGTSFDDGGTLALSFLLDKTFAPAGALLTQGEDGAVHGRAFGGDAALVQRQVARILGLDVDARGYDTLCAAD